MDKKTSIFGIILVVLGVLLLFSRFEIHLFQFLFPAALIVLGVWFIWRKNSKDTSIPPPPNGYYRAPSSTATPGMPPGPGMPPPPITPHDPMAPPPPPPGSSYQSPTRPAAFPQVDGGKVKYSKFLGDMFIECQNINMQNVEISMFAGDLQINLRGGKLAPGLNRMIVSGFLGDIMIFVPQGLPVFVHCSGFVGDLDLMGRRSSGFGNTLDAQTAEYDSTDAKLYIAVNNFIGDVRVYSI